MDVPADLPGGAPTPETLSFCEDNVIRNHGKDGTKDFKSGTFHPAYRNKALLRAVKWSFPFGFLPFLFVSPLGRLQETGWQGYRHVVDRAKSSLALENRFGRPFTNASGDFILMSKRSWIELGGYFEYPGFPRHIDGLLLYRALRYGVSEKIFSEPARVYHIEHGEGSGFEEYVSGKLEERLKQEGVPFISSTQLLQWLLAIAEESGDVPENNAQWGLGDETLEERVVSSLSS